uniref:Uncharacterized protein n=1 Tax=Oryza meridionalis TaxID=40149 RepID=A0A0E0DYS3_9ORYZ
MPLGPLAGPSILFLSLLRFVLPAEMVERGEVVVVVADEGVDLSGMRRNEMGTTPDVDDAEAAALQSALQDDDGTTVFPLLEWIKRDGVKRKFVRQDELSMERKRDKDDRGLVMNMIIVFISAGDGIETKEAAHACSLDVVGSRVESKMGRPSWEKTIAAAAAATRYAGEAMAFCPLLVALTTHRKDNFVSSFGGGAKMISKIHKMAKMVKWRYKWLPAYNPIVSIMDQGPLPSKVGALVTDR